MDLIKKKTSFNTTRYFTRSKPLIKKYEGEKYESKLLLSDNVNRRDFGGLRYKNFYKTSLKDKPLISIITPNFKSPDLEKTIISVLKQEYENLELIIIDADSGEETVQILKKYEDQIDLWVSEKDNGLWDGWNKGLKFANGDYIGILDSTSTFDINAIKYLIKYVKKYPEADCIFGTVKKGDKIYAGFRPEDIIFRFNIYPSCVIGFFIKKNSLKTLGLYNTKYKIHADYDLIYRLIVKEKMRGVPTRGDEIFGAFGEVGISGSYTFFQRLFSELKIRYDNNQNIFIIVFIFFGRCYKQTLKNLFKFKK